MKVHRIPHASFETARSRFIQILYHCSVSRKITPLYFFLSQTFILWTKRTHRSKISRLLSVWVKTHQISDVIFETTSQFFLNFASLFSVMRDNSSVLFQLKLCMIWTKGAQQSAKFQTFDCSHKISPNVHFDRLLLLKVYKNFCQKHSEELCLIILDIDAYFEEKLVCCFKNDKNLMNFDPSTQKSQKFSLSLVPIVQSI